MTRFFYSDPLAAAWMAKHFEMDFIRTDLHKWQERQWKAEQLDQALRSGIYYVHPDSLHLLQPQVGDVVQNPDDDVARVCRNEEEEVFQGWVKLADTKEFVGSAATIIQRNGIPFMWPEQEAA